MKVSRRLAVDGQVDRAQGLLDQEEQLEHDQWQIGQAGRAFRPAPQQRGDGKVDGHDHGREHERAVHHRRLDEGQQVRAEHQHREAGQHVPARMQAAVAARAGQDAEMTRDVQGIADAGEPCGTDLVLDGDGAEHARHREKQARQRPVEQTGPARAGEVQESHADGHDRARQRGSHH
jgi:hypothetical protein